MVDRTEVLEDALRTLTNTMKSIASEQCQYVDASRNRPKPCDCAPCEAKAALRSTQDYRYVGSRPERLENGHNPREEKMHAAWKKQVDDKMLGQVLYAGQYEAGFPQGFVEIPTPRDWYVATSVVQWLATNVGSAILENAGFKYTGYEQDQDLRDIKDAHLRGIRFTPNELQALVLHLRHPPGTLKDELIHDCFTSDATRKHFQTKLEAVEKLVTK